MIAYLLIIPVAMATLGVIAFPFLTFFLFDHAPMVQRFALSAIPALFFWPMLAAIALKACGLAP